MTGADQDTRSELTTPAGHGQVERLVGRPDTERTDFEAWISAPPFERRVMRFPESACAWPGTYRDIEVDLAWQAWQAAIRTKRIQT